LANFVVKVEGSRRICDFVPDLGGENGDDRRRVVGRRLGQQRAKGLHAEQGSDGIDLKHVNHFLRRDLLPFKIWILETLHNPSVVYQMRDARPDLPLDQFGGCLDGIDVCHIAVYEHQLAVPFCKGCKLSRRLSSVRSNHVPALAENLGRVWGFRGLDPKVQGIEFRVQIRFCTLAGHLLGIFFFGSRFSSSGLGLRVMYLFHHLQPDSPGSAYDHDLRKGCRKVEG